MPVEFDNSGAKKLIEKLEAQPESEQVDFPPEFMRKYTDYESIDELVAASGFSPDDVRSFQETPNERWEQFIREHTRFDSWRGFMETFTIEHLRGQSPEFQ